MIVASPVASEIASLPASFAVGGTDLPLWPAGLDGKVVAGAQIVVTEFPDAALYHPALIAAALEAERDPRFHDPTERVLRGTCGVKVRNLHAWESPAARLIHARAIVLACRALSRASVFVDESWGSIYRNGAYCMPHSHVRSDANVVYFLDTGESDTGDPLAGQFCICDPRIPMLCQFEPGRMHRQFMPPMVPGKMLIFAGEYVHSVNPYFGSRPRITLSWNITRECLPGRAHENL
jgi:hypothetical protein